MSMENIQKLNLNHYLFPMNMPSQSDPTNGQAPEHTNVIRMAEEKDKWDRKGVTTTYHRMTALEARKYVEKLRDDDSRESKVQLEKLQDDENHIMKCRARLSQNSNTKELQQKLKVLYQSWRDEVNARNGDEEMGRLRDKREDLVKPSICAERREDSAKLTDDDDPAHDMKAYFMFFEKDGQAWKGKTLHDQGFPKYESFPNQRIPVYQALYSESHNPFTPTRDGEGKPHLRYIHIPANHMGVSEYVTILFVLYLGMC